MQRIFSYVVAVAFLIFAAGSVAFGEEKPAPKAEAVKGESVKDAKAVKDVKLPAKQDTVATASGLKYVELKAGMGAVPKTGQTLDVHYTVWLADGKKIQSSKDTNQPLSFKLGGGQMIKGFEEGLSTMKVGGTRKLIIPPQLAWGDRGAGKDIPPNSTVIFEVELLGVK